MKKPARVSAKQPMPREALLEALAQVAADYSDFVASWHRGDQPADPKAFAAHQAAARSALAHMVELAGLAGIETPDDASPEDLAATVLAKARKSMEQEGEG